MASVADFADLRLWQPLPPVDPGVDSRAWAMRRIPVCAVDGRKWAGTQRSVIVTCSGPAQHWETTNPFGGGYGYCAYHWALRQAGILFSTPPVPNPKYTQADRQRDQEIVEAYFAQRRADHERGYYPPGL